MYDNNPTLPEIKKEIDETRQGEALFFDDLQAAGKKKHHSRKNATKNKKQPAPITEA